MANCRHDYKLIFLVFCIVSVTLAGSVFRCKNGGKENQAGGCDCLPCHKGDTCEQIVNKKPYFETDEQEVTVDTEYRENELVYVASAYDKDTDEVCNDVPSCPCGEITYSIESGNDDNTFTIDPTLGIIRLNGFQDISENEGRQLVISARNLFDESAVSTMILGVRGKMHTVNQYSAEINNGYDGTYHVDTSAHERVKRATAAPSNVTFDLQKDAAHTSTTVIRPGQRIGFELKIDFPVGTTDMLVELFAPDNNSIVMMLCDVRVASIGSNLNHTTAPVEIKLESKNNSIFYDWAIIDFGNVTNNNDNDDQHSIVIKYDAVMIQNADTVDGTTYWVSAGAEYNDENEVWVGQASFTSDIVTQWDASANKPQFNFSGPNTLAIGESAIFAVDMYITYPSIGLGFDAFAPLNDTSIMSICGIQIEGVGVNYQCGLDYTAVPSSLHQDGQARGNARGHLDIGVATNKGIRDDTSSVGPNLIRVEFVMKVWDDVTALGSYDIGAALELGSDQIWCGQISVNVVARLIPSIASPLLSLAYVGNVTEVSESQPVVIEISAETITESKGDFKIDVKSDLNGGNEPLLQICALTFISAGENMPCIATDREAVLTSQGNKPLITDTATLDFGVLSNVGNWGYFNHSRNDTRNTMVLRILVKGTEFTTTTQNIKIGLTSGSGSHIVLETFAITKAASSSLPEIVDTPQMNLTYKYSSGTVRIGEAVTMFYEISTLRGQTFPVFDMEFIAPNSSDSAIVSICKAKTTKLGKNTPCLTKEAIDSKWQYLSQFEQSSVDRVTLSLGSICNFEVTDNATEDTIVLSAVFQLKPHPDATNGKQMYLSAGSQYTPTKMWIGQLSMTVDTSAFPAPQASKEPQIYLAKVGEFDSASTPIAYPATYQVIIQTYPGETIDLKLVLTTTTNKVSFCSLKLKAVGSNMPCVDETIKAVITKDAATGLNKDAELTIGPVTNVGDLEDATGVGNSTFGINSLAFEIIMQSSITATNGESLQFKVETNALMAPVSENLVVTSDKTGITMLGNATGIDFKVAAVVESDDNYDVYKGQAKKFFIDIDTQLDTTQHVTAQLMTSIGSTAEFEIAYIGLVEVGENLACVSREMTTSTYEKRSGSSYIDIGAIDLGYVCNTGINRNDSAANKIRIEAFARLLNNPALTVSSTVSLSAAVNFNDEQIFIAEKDMTIMDVSSFTDLVLANVTLTNGTAINVNSTATPIVMTIAQVDKIPVILNIPPFTVSKIQFDIDLPMSGTASMTFKGLEIVGSGQNLCRYGYTEDYTVTELSTQNTTQINKVFVDMGIVSNIGYTHTLGTDVPEDDIIYALVEVQMADSDTNDKDAEMWLGLGAKIASFIIVSDHKVKVDRTGNEEPVFNFTASYDSVTSTNVYAEIDVVLEHAMTSTAEYQNTVLKFNTPPYLEYKDIPSTNPTTTSYTVNNINSNAIEINLGRFFFTDRLEMTVAFEVNATYGVPPGIVTSAAVTGVEVICNMIERTAPSFRNGSEEFTSGFQTVNGTYTTTPKSSDSSCTAGVIANIQTCQFSSCGDDISTPDNAVYTGTGWAPPIREGKLGKLRYLQYDFGERVSLTQIAYKHTETDKISKIQLRYSNDGISFLDGELLTIGTADGSVSVNSILKYKVIRLYIDDVTTANQKVGLTVQFTGCYVDTTPASYTCPLTPTIPAEYERRSFVADDTHVYVCDGTPGKRSQIDTMCFASSDGDKWKALDKRVSCMVGHNKDPKGDERLYALSYNYQYMTSKDKGDTWQVVGKGHVDNVKIMSTYIQAVKVPWTGTPSDTDKSLLNWQSAYQGMSPAAGPFVNKFKWDTCCP